jgi:hypothetical protein
MSAFKQLYSPHNRLGWAPSSRRPAMLKVRFLDRLADRPTAELGRQQPILNRLSP